MIIKKWFMSQSKQYKKGIFISVGVLIFVILILLVQFNVIGKSSLASVLSLDLKLTPTLVCNDSDGGKNYTKQGIISTNPGVPCYCKTPEIVFACLLGIDCPVECQGTGQVTCIGSTRDRKDSCNKDGTLKERFCLKDYPTSQDVSCQNGFQCSQGACIPKGVYGYGYGYNGTGYGYGYGYKRLDAKTDKPYLYLLTVFKTYSTEIYNDVMKKLGFQISSSYNKKEFPSTK